MLVTEKKLASGSVVDLCKFLSNATLKLFRKYDEDNCYIVTDSLKDLVKDKGFIKAWYSRSQNNLTAVKAIKEIIFVKEGRF